MYVIEFIQKLVIGFLYLLTKMSSNNYIDEIVCYKLINLINIFFITGIKATRLICKYSRFGNEDMINNVLFSEIVLIITGLTQPTTHNDYSRLKLIIQNWIMTCIFCQYSKSS